MPPDAALSWVITILIPLIAGVVGCGESASRPQAVRRDLLRHAGNEILHNGG
jgi:hypothetical protein